MTQLPAALPFVLEREVLIRAPRPLVFRYFTDSARFARWWGAGSTIEGRVGGAVHIVYPGGSVASGTVLALEPERRIVFSYGYEGEKKPIAPGGSRVTIELADVAAGTQLRLVHEIHDATVRDHHVQGWRYQLALFANAVANELHAGAAQVVDGWFAAWNEPDEARRNALLAAVTTADVVSSDAFSALRGREDLAGHVTATRAHMPGVVVARQGDVRHCQGMVLADWSLRTADGRAVGGGRDVFELDPAGRIERVVGFWDER
jgi:uncharacterized protein YndB with AHSA1/START domain